jgi:hypothetical protein
MKEIRELLNVILTAVLAARGMFMQGRDSFRQGQANDVIDTGFHGGAIPDLLTGFPQRDDFRRTLDDGLAFVVGHALR